MAGSLSDYAENKVLDHLTGKTSFTMPTISVGLLLGNPGEANSGAGWMEVAHASGYERVATAGADWNAASGGATSNANAITFPQASGSWGTVMYFGLFDSAVVGEGNLIAYGDLTTSKAIDNGDTAQFAAGELDLTAS